MVATIGDGSCQYSVQAIYRRPNTATGRVRRHAQRGIFDSQVVREKLEDNTGCSRSWTYLTCLDILPLQQGSDAGR